MNTLLPKRLYAPIEPRPDAPEGEPVKAFVFGTPKNEADWIAQDILNRGLDPKDVCICYRMRAVGAFMERSLMMNQIPFVNLNGSTFLRLKHIQMTWQYLALVYGDKAQVKDAYQYTYRIASDRMVQPSAMRSRETGTVLKEQGEAINHRWIGKSWLQWNDTIEKARRNYPKMKGWKARGVEDLLYTYDTIKDQRTWQKSLDWIIEHVTIPWYVLEHGVSVDTDGSFADDMGIFREIVDGFAEPAELFEYVKNVDKAAESGEGVTLGTFHKVKGGEWELVYTAGMAMKICPTSWAMGLAPEPDPGYLPPPPSNPGMIDEIFCFYVGITRAKNYCVVTCPTFWNGKPTGPSTLISYAGLELEYAD